MRPEHYFLRGWWVSRHTRATNGTRLIGFPDEVPVGGIIVFENADPNQYKSVDSRLLKLHASLAVLMHMCGAAEVIDRYLRDREDIRVLSADGASAYLLSAALRVAA